MRKGHFAILVSALSASLIGTAVAGDGAGPRKLIDKAIEVQGGEANLAKWHGFTAKIRGKIYEGSESVPFTGEVAAEGPDRQRSVIETNVGGQKNRSVEILNGAKGWTQENGETEELDKDDLHEAKESAHSDWITTLVPLKDKAFKLSLLGTVVIDKKPALGVKVSRTGYRDTNLYFDKETGLLVKTEMRTKNDDGDEVTEEQFLSDYKEVQGTKQALKVAIRREGKRYMDLEFLEYRLAEKLDGALFARP